MMFSTPAERRRIDTWRRDVADCAAPVVIRSDNRSFRNGVPAPVQVHTDDGRSFKSVRTPSASYEPTITSRRPHESSRRTSSDHGHYPRRSSVHTSSRTTDRYSKPPSRYDRYDKYDKYGRRDSISKQSTSIWSSLFPSSKTSRSRTVTNDRPLRRTPSPEYVYRDDEPGVTVYSSRPKSQYAPARAPRKEYIVTRSGAKGGSRRDSFGLEDRTRLLEIRDRFREEVDRARQWQPSTRPPRRRESDRRSSYY